MASGAFNLTAQINLQGPKNVGSVVADIKKQLGTINANVNLTISANAARNVSQLTTGLQALNQAFKNVQSGATSAASAVAQFNSAVGNMQIKAYQNNLTSATTASQQFSQTQSKTAQSLAASSSEMEEFGRQAGLAVRRFAAFTGVTSIIFGVTSSISKGVSAFIDFDKELVKLQQVTGESAAGLASLQNTITSLSTNLGVGSAELLGVSSTLAQAGLSARDTEKALKALALSSLAPSFDNMNETVEGSIALMRQFGIGAGDLTKALGSVNAVSAKFAVEASDIIAAIQRTGGVFASASKGVSEGTSALNEFIAVFTSVRATTRESAETIATGLRTIFTRIQRENTIDALKEYGVNLTDLNGKFVGAYRAVELLSKGLNSIDPRDLRFSRIVEELGGFRQIGKVIPLIQEFSTAQQALTVAQSGQNSLTADAVKAQLSLANQVSKVREEFLALFREIGSSDTFQNLVRGSLQAVSAIIKVADAVKGVLPVLAVLGISKGLDALTKFGAGLYTGIRKGPDNKQGGFADGGAVHRFASGGVVPGYGKGDKVRALLEPGEVVMNNYAADRYGRGNLVRMNRYGIGGYIESPLSGLKTGQGNIKYSNKVQPKDEVGTKINPIPIELKQNEFPTLLDYIKQGYQGNIQQYNKFSGQSPQPKYGNETPESFFKKKSIDTSHLSLPLPRPPAEWAKGNAFEQLLINKYNVRKTKSNSSSSTFEDIVKEHFESLDFDDGDAKFEQKAEGYFSKAPGAEKPLKILSKRLRDQQDVLSWTTGKDSFTNKNNNPLKDTSVYYPVEPEKTKKEFDKYYAEEFNKSIIENAQNTKISTTDIGKSIFSRPVYSNGGLIQKFMAGGVADESTAMTLENAKKKSRKEIIDLLASRPGGISTTERAAKVGRGQIYEILGQRNPDAATESLKEAILREYVKTHNRRSGASQAQLDRMSKQGLVVAAAGMFGKKFADTTETIESELLSSNVKVRIMSGVMGAKTAASLESIFTKGTEELTDKGAETLLISDILEKFGLGRELNLDFDRTLAIGADEILSDPGSPVFSEFSNRDKVLGALQKAKLTALGEAIAASVKERPELLGLTKIVTARPDSTLDLVQDWLSSQGLPIPRSQMQGFGGAGIKADDIAKLKAAFLGPGSLFVDDDPRNISAASLRKDVTSYQYGIGKSLPNSQSEGDIQGLLLERVIQKLGGPGASKGFGFDFPRGLGPAAKFFDLPDDIPTDVKRTITGPSTITDNIVTYLKNVLGYKLGGQVYNLQKGTGLSNTEFDQLIKYGNTNDFTELEFKDYLANYLKNKTAKRDLRVNSEQLRQVLLSGTTTQSPSQKQTDLANQLMGEPDAKFNPKYDNARRTFVSGGLAIFSDGGHVPAMVSNGEAFVPPQTAKRIGYDKLNRMNQADKLGGLRSFSSGGISVFKGPGTGTSDSIGPIPLPVGSFVIREAATKALGLRDGGAVGVQKFAAGGEAIEAIIRLKEEKETKESEKRSLLDRAKTAVGTEKVLVDSQIKQVEQELTNLDKSISSAVNQFDSLSDTITTAARAEDSRQKSLSDANARLVQKIREQAQKSGIDFDSLTDSVKLQQIRQARITNRVTIGGTTTDVSAENTDIERAENRLDKATKIKERAQRKRDNKFGGAESIGAIESRALTANELKIKRDQDRQFFEYKGKKEGTTAEGYKYGLARQLGQAAYQAQEQYSGRSQEMVYELTGKQESLSNLGSTIKSAQEKTKTGTAAEKQAAATQLADAQSRLAMEAENIAKSMRDLNPTLSMGLVQTASKEIADLLSNGKLAEAQQKMAEALGKTPEGAEAMNIAMQRMAKELNIDVNTLRREFGSGSGAKTLQLQQFASSREGQRYGSLSEMAPALAQSFDKLDKKLFGGGLGKTSDFMSGQGGRYSQAFSKMGGMTSLSFGIAAAPGLVQKALGDPTSSQGAAAYAGAQGAASVAGAGLQFAASTGPFAPFVIAGTAAAALATALKDSRNAFIEFEKNLRSKNIQKALEGTAAAFEALARDAKDQVAQQQISEKLVTAGKEAGELNKIDQTIPKAFYMNLFDSTGKEAADRSKILEKQGTMAYLSSLDMFGGASQRRAYTSAMIPEQAQDNARQYAEISSQTKQFIEARGRSGQTFEEIKASPDYASLAKNIALANVSVQEQILAIDNSTAYRTDADRQAAKEAIIRAHADKEISKMMLASDRAKAAAELEKTSRSFSMSFKRLFDNMEASIARSNSELTKFNNALDVSISAMSGNARNSNIQFESLDVLKNPRAYSQTQVDAANNQAASLFGPDASIVSGLAGLGDKLETSLLKSINSTLSKNKDASDTKVMIDLEKSIGDQVAGLSLPKDLSSQLSKEIAAAVGDMRREGTKKVDIDELMDRIPALKNSIESAKNAQNASIAALQNWQNSLNSYSDAMNRAADMEMQAADLRMKATDIVIEGTMSLGQALGKDFGADIGARLRDQRVGGMTGGLTNPTSIRNRMDELNDQRQRQQAEVDLSKQQSVGGNQSAIQNVINNEKLLKQTNNQLRQTSAALKHLAESGSAASAALNAIQEAQRKQQGKIGLIEKLVTSGPEELFNFNKSLNSLNRMSAGQTVQQTAEERRDTLSTLNDIAPLLGSGQQANNIKANVLESMLRDSGVGVSTQFKEILNALRNPESDNETQQAIKVYQDAIQVQSDANIQLAEINQGLAEDIANTTAKAIKEALTGITISFNKAQLDDIAKGIRAPATLPETKALGGLIYASAGTMVDFSPRGTDTVPAMLTPGEFVVNRTATANNLGLLHDINSGKTKYYSDGGYVSNLAKPDFQASDSTFTTGAYPELGSWDSTKPIKGYSNIQAMPLFNPKQEFPLSEFGSFLFKKTGTSKEFSADNYILGAGYPLGVTTGFIEVASSAGAKLLASVTAPPAPIKETGNHNFLDVDHPDASILRSKTKQIEKNQIDQYKDRLKEISSLLPSSLDVSSDFYDLGYGPVFFPTAGKAKQLSGNIKPKVSVSSTHLGGYSAKLSLTSLARPLEDTTFGPFFDNIDKDNNQQNLPDYYIANLTGGYKNLVASTVSETSSKISSVKSSLGLDPFSLPINIESIDYIKRFQEIFEKIKLTKEALAKDSPDSKSELDLKVLSFHKQLEGIYKGTKSREVFTGDFIDLDGFTTSDSLQVFGVSTDTWKNKYIKDIEDAINHSDKFKNLEYFGKDPDKRSITIAPEDNGLMTGPIKEFPWIGGGDFEFTEAAQKAMEAEVAESKAKMEGTTSGRQSDGNILLQKPKIKLPYHLSYLQYSNSAGIPGSSPVGPNEKVYLVQPLESELSIFKNLKEKAAKLFVREDGMKNHRPIDQIDEFLNKDNGVNDYFDALKKYGLTDSRTTDLEKGIKDKMVSIKKVDFLKPINPGDFSSFKEAYSDSISLRLGDYLELAAKHAAKNLNRDLKDEAKLKMKNKDDIGSLTEKQYHGASLALILGAQELFSAGSPFELPDLLGNGWFHPTLGNEYKSIYDVDVPTLRLYMGKLSQVFDNRVSRLNQLMGRVPDSYRDKAVAGLTNLYGATQAFKAIADGDTGSFSGMFGKDDFKNQTPGGDPQMNTKAKELIQSLGMRLRMGGVGGETFTKDQMRERENQLEGVKVNTGSSSNQVKDIGPEKLPKTYMELFDLAINPYNEFPNRDRRRDLIQEFISNIPTARDPGSNTLLFGQETGALFSEALTQLKNWYGGEPGASIGDGKWLGTDLLTESGTPDTTDQFSKEPKSYQVKFNELKTVKNDTLYLDAGAGYNHIGGKQKFGDLPNLDYYEKLQYRRTGGMIYAAQGKLVNFQPQGTDTVPAMLTPGEFVVNARATAEHLPLLQAINSGDTKGFNRGGAVYLAKGGQPAASNSADEQAKRNHENVMGRRKTRLEAMADELKDSEVVPESVINDIKKRGSSMSAEKIIKLWRENRLSDEKSRTKSLEQEIARLKSQEKPGGFLGFGKVDHSAEIKKLNQELYNSSVKAENLSQPYQRLTPQDKAQLERNKAMTEANIARNSKDERTWSEKNIGLSLGAGAKTVGEQLSAVGAGLAVAGAMATRQDLAKYGEEMSMLSKAGQNVGQGVEFARKEIPGAAALMDATEGSSKVAIGGVRVVAGGIGAGVGAASNQLGYTSFGNTLLEASKNEVFRGFVGTGTGAIELGKATINALGNTTNFITGGQSNSQDLGTSLLGKAADGGNLILDKLYEQKIEHARKVGGDTTAMLVTGADAVGAGAADLALGDVALGSVLKTANATAKTTRAVAARAFVKPGSVPGSRRLTMLGDLAVGATDATQKAAKTVSSVIDQMKKEADFSLFTRQGLRQAGSEIGSDLSQLVSGFRAAPGMILDDFIPSRVQARKTAEATIRAKKIEETKKALEFTSRDAGLLKQQQLRDAGTTRLMRLMNRAAKKGVGGASVLEGLVKRLNHSDLSPASVGFAEEFLKPVGPFKTEARLNPGRARGSRPVSDVESPTDDFQLGTWDFPPETIDTARAVGATSDTGQAITKPTAKPKKHLAYSIGRRLGTVPGYLMDKTKGLLDLGFRTQIPYTGPSTYNMAKDAVDFGRSITGAIATKVSDAYGTVKQGILNAREAAQAKKIAAATTAKAARTTDGMLDAIEYSDDAKKYMSGLSKKQLAAFREVAKTASSPEKQVKLLKDLIESANRDNLKFFEGEDYIRLQEELVRKGELSAEQSADILQNIRGSYNSGRKQVKINPNIARSTTRIHELTHYAQDMTGNLTPIKGSYAALRDMVGTNLDRFLEGEEYASIVDGLGSSYTGDAIKSKPHELLTMLTQGKSDKDTKHLFTERSEAQKILTKLWEAHGYQKGGIVYANNGALIAAQQNNTDNVPAMLTPGEFVVNREAAQRFMPTLTAINSGHFANGGRIQYLANGGVVQPKYLASGNMVDNIANMSSQSGVLNNTASSGISMQKPAWVDDFINRLNQSGAVFNQGATRVVEGANIISSAGQDIKTANPTLTVGGNVNLANAGEIIEKSLNGMMPIAQNAGNAARQASAKDMQDQWNKKTDYA